MHKLSLPDLFQGSFIMTEAKSLFPRSRIQKCITVPFKKNYFVHLVYALKIIQCFKKRLDPASACLFSINRSILFDAVRTGCVLISPSKSHCTWPYTSLSIAALLLHNIVKVHIKDNVMMHIKY